jgi:hypothetical protein
LSVNKEKMKQMVWTCIAGSYRKDKYKYEKTNMLGVSPTRFR